MKKLLLIGNGPIFCRSNEFFINKHINDFVLNLSRNYSCKYFQFNVKVDSENMGLQDSLIENEKLAKVKICNKSNIIYKAYSYFGILKSLARYVKNSDFVYIFYPSSLALFASFFCTLFGKKYGLYIRGSFDDRSFLQKLIIKNSSFNISVSPGFLKDISTFGVKGALMRPMFDLSEQDITEVRAVRDTTDYKVLFVGRLEQAKGVLDLIDVIESLSQEHDNVHFTIVGGGPLFDKLKKLYGNNHKVKITGVITEKEQLLSIYRASDCLLQLSYSEGFPRVIYEAMACGTVVITTLVGGIPSIVTPNLNVLDVPVGSPTSVHKRIISLMKDKELELQCKRNATTLVLEKLKLPTHYDLLVKEVEDVI